MHEGIVTTSSVHGEVRLSSTNLIGAIHMSTYNPYLSRLSGIAYVAAALGVILLLVGIVGNAPAWVIIGGVLFLIGALSYIGFLVGSAVTHERPTDSSNGA